MSELALLRDWTAADPSTTAEDRGAVLRLLLECGKRTLGEVTELEQAVFLLTYLPAKAANARKAYDRALPAFFAWANGREAELSTVMLLRDYRSFMLATGSSPKTERQYLRCVLRLLAVSSGARSLNDIGEDEVVALLKPFRVRSSAREGYYRALKSFYKWAVRRGHVPVDPTEGITVKGPREKEPDAFSPAEIVALLDCAASVNPRHAALILLAYSLGLRRSEVCGITMDDVDWANARVRIRPEIAKGGQGRYVEMNDYAREAIEALRPYANGTLAGGMAPDWFTMLVHATAKRAGFPPGRRNSHMLRSSFATHLLAASVPISVVSKLLGHSKVSTTSRYLAVVDADRHAAVATVKLPPSAASAKGPLRWKAASG